MNKKTWPAHMLPKRDPLQKKNPTDWKWRVGKKNCKQMDRKKSWSSNTYIRQNRVQNKSHKKRPWRTLHNGEGKNPSKRHKNYKCICTQHRSTQIHKISEDFKKGIDSNTTVVGDFNTPLSKMDRSSKQNINKDIVALNNTLDEMDLTDIYIYIEREPFAPKKQKTHSFQMHMEHFQT